LELFVGQQVGLVEYQDGGTAAFVAFGGQCGAGLADQSGGQVGGVGGEGGDDGFVDAADADHGVAQVDDGVAGGVQAGPDGAHGHGLAGADLAGDHAAGAFGPAPADPGDGIVVRGVASEHARGEGAAGGGSW